MDSLEKKNSEYKLTLESLDLDKVVAKREDFIPREAKFKASSIANTRKRVSEFFKKMKDNAVSKYEEAKQEHVVNKMEEEVEEYKETKDKHKNIGILANRLFSLSAKIISKEELKEVKINAGSKYSPKAIKLKGAMVSNLLENIGHSDLAMEIDKLFGKTFGLNNLEEETVEEEVTPIVEEKDESKDLVNSILTNIPEEVMEQPEVTPVVEEEVTEEVEVTPIVEEPEIEVKEEVVMAPKVEMEAIDMANLDEEFNKLTEEKKDVFALNNKAEEVDKEVSKVSKEAERVSEEERLAKEKLERARVEEIEERRQVVETIRLQKELLAKQKTELENRIKNGTEEIQKYTQKIEEVSKSKEEAVAETSKVSKNVESLRAMKASLMEYVEVSRTDETEKNVNNRTK